MRRRHLQSVPDLPEVQTRPLPVAWDGKPVRLTKIEPTRKQVAVDDTELALSLDQLAQLQPDDVFRRLWLQKYGAEAPPEQIASFAELFHAVEGEPR